ncbi:hypothetical protein D3C73_972760 [compost metagenome]
MSLLQWPLPLGQSDVFSLLQPGLHSQNMPEYACPYLILLLFINPGIFLIDVTMILAMV